MKIKNPRLLMISLVAPQVAGIIGSYFTAPSIPTWYVQLNKPAFNPPNWIFGPVWITLYFLMGISLYLVWIKEIKKEKLPNKVRFFFIHLIFNSFWSIVFFGFKDVAVALVVIAILWLMIAYMMKVFWKIDKRASYLLIPYLMWVSFATFLNYSIWQLN